MKVLLTLKLIFLSFQLMALDSICSKRFKTYDKENYVGQALDKYNCLLNIDGGVLELKVFAKSCQIHEGGNLLDCAMVRTCPNDMSKPSDFSTILYYEKNFLKSACEGADFKILDLKSKAWVNCKNGLPIGIILQNEKGIKKRCKIPLLK